MVVNLLTAAKAPTPSQMEHPPTPPTLQLRVLVAEDNPVNQLVTQQMLAKLGHRADVAATGLEVIAALARKPYDVVLMDLHMPEMDGLKTTRQIRRNLDLDGIKIIAMTAAVLNSDQEACRNAGMDDFIAKPVRLNELQATLDEVMSSDG